MWRISHYALKIDEVLAWGKEQAFPLGLSDLSLAVGGSQSSQWIEHGYSKQKFLADNDSFPQHQHTYQTQRRKFITASEIGCTAQTHLQVEWCHMLFSSSSSLQPALFITYSLMYPPILVIIIHSLNVTKTMSQWVCFMIIIMSVYNAINLQERSIFAVLCHTCYSFVVTHVNDVRLS